MPGLIGQHLPTGFVPNPPLGSSTLLFDYVGDLVMKRNDGTVEPVGKMVYIDYQQISFGGTSSGLTSSSIFTIDTNYGNLIFGQTNSIIGTSSFNSIIGGQSSTISDCSNNSSIIGGVLNTIDINSEASSVIGGFQNNISSGIISNILGGGYNQISNSSGSTIIGAAYANISNSYSSIILNGFGNPIEPIVGTVGGNRIVGGRFNIVGGGFLVNPYGGTPSVNLPNGICNSGSSVNIGGGGNLIQNSYFSSVLSSFISQIYDSESSSILGGCSNVINCYSYHSAILGGTYNNVDFYSRCSSILSGYQNSLLDYSYASVISGGGFNLIQSSYNSVILGGNTNTINNNDFLSNNSNSSVIGGQGNIISTASAHSSVIGALEIAFITLHRLLQFCPVYQIIS